jgi:hypothetical protein
MALDAADPCIVEGAGETAIEIPWYQQYGWEFARWYLSLPKELQAAVGFNPCNRLSRLEKRPSQGQLVVP